MNHGCEIQMKIRVEPFDRGSPEDLDLEGCQALARHVAHQAAMDWRKAVNREIKTNATRMSWARRECEMFFKSNWFHSLTGCDGKWILERLKKEMRDEGKAVF